MLKIVNTLEDAMELKRWISERDKSFTALDTETTGVDFFDPNFRVRIIQFGSDKEAWIVPVEQWLGLVKDICENYSGRWLIHNARFDIGALATHGIKIPWYRVDDTMIAMRLAEPIKPAGLKQAATRHVSRSASGSQSDLHKAMKTNKWDWDTVPIDFPPYVYYAAMDVILTSRLYLTQICQRGLHSPVYELEMDVRHVCSTMENKGMRVDMDFSRKTGETLREEAEKLQAEIASKYGFALMSTSDLSRWLLGQGAPLTKLTNGGKPSVDKEALDDLAQLHDLPPMVKEVVEKAVRCRKVLKMASSYFDNFVELADSNALLHPSIETVAARTGRMSIRTPALQTLPRISDDPDSKLVRNAVIPRADGEVLVSSDYEQIELRIVASLSEDPGLIEAFKVADETGLDFFTQSARQVYNDDTIQKSDGRRPTIKSLYYAASYGAGVKKMALTAGVPVEEMQDVKDRVFSRYPGMGKFMKDSEKMCRENDGWVTTQMGRALYVDPDMAYKAANARIQGTAADVLKLAVVNMANAGLDEFMVVPVHDEVVLSVPQDELENAREVCRNSMADYSMSVPLLAEPSDGYMTWGSVPK